MGSHCDYEVLALFLSLQTSESLLAADTRGSSPIMEFRKDGGLAWLVLFASFLSHMLNIGFSYAVLGSLTLHHAAESDITISASSWISAVHIGVFLMCGEFRIHKIVNPQFKGNHLLHFHILFLLKHLVTSPSLRAS